MKKDRKICLTCQQSTSMAAVEMGQKVQGEQGLWTEQSVK